MSKAGATQLANLELSVLEALILLEDEHDAPPLRPVELVAREAGVSRDRTVLVLRGLEAQGLVAHADAIVTVVDHYGVPRRQQTFGWRLVEPNDAKQLADAERQARQLKAQAGEEAETAATFTPQPTPRSRLSPLAERACA